MSLEAVIFDMDGVLTATVEYHYLSWKKVVQEYNIPFSRQDNEKLLGLTRPRSLEVILGDRFFTNEQKEEILKQKNQAFLELIEERLSPSDLQPGVEHLLKELRQTGIQIAVASASRNVEMVLSRLKILDYFDAIIDGNTVQRSKPAPDAFLAAASTLGVPPQHCIVLEDSVPGIQAAISAGMCAIGLGLRECIRHAHAVYNDLSSVHVKDLESVYLRKSQQPG